MKKDWIGLEHLPRLLGIFGTLAIFGVLNVVLWFGQDLWHYKERKELRALQAELSALKTAADTLEAQLKHEDTGITAIKVQLDGCHSRVEEYEADAVDNTLPPTVYDRYQATIVECNNTATVYNARANSYNNVYETYSATIDQHNALVQRGNELAKIVGTHYYFVPVPSFGGGRRPSHE